MVNVDFNIKLENGEGNLYLHLTEEPVQTFYKDEGGKSNNLKCACMVDFQPKRTDFCHSNNNDIKKNKEKIPIGNLKLNPTLVYENGSPVEDADDIFKIVKINPTTITATNEPCEVHFRIDKVSRRKDGRKFRLLLQVDRRNSTLLHYVSTKEMEAQMTNSIVVLSKRKSNLKKNMSFKMLERHVNKDDQRKIPKLFETNLRNSLDNLQRLSLEEEYLARKRSAKREHESKAEERKMIQVPEDFLVKLHKTNVKLEETVRNLVKRVSILETELLSKENDRFNEYKLSERCRLHSLVMDDAENTGKGQSSNGRGMPRNNSSTAELLDFLQGGSILN